MKCCKAEMLFLFQLEAAVAGAGRALPQPVQRAGHQDHGQDAVCILMPSPSRCQQGCCALALKYLLTIFTSFL